MRRFFRSFRRISSRLSAAPLRYCPFLQARNMRNVNGVEEISSVLPSRCYRCVSEVVRWILTAVVKLWTFCTTSLLVLFLLYWLYGSIPTLLLLIASVIGFFYNAQDVLLYYPDNPPQSRLYVESPALLSLPYENVYTRTRDGVRINMQLILQPEDRRTSAPTVVYFHGNAGNIGHRMANVYFMYIYLGVNVLMVEYRGYGKSEGSPCERGLYLDAEAALDYLLDRPDIHKQKLVVFGRSLGGAVAVNLVSSQYQSAVCCLWLENTFTSLPDIARHVFSISLVSYLPLYFFKSQYPSMSRMKKIRVPTLFLSGQADSLIPPNMMTRLYENSRSVFKRIARFDGGTHNETWRCGGYYEAIKNFLDEVCEKHLATMETASPSNEQKVPDCAEDANDTDALIEKKQYTELNCFFIVTKFR